MVALDIVASTVEAAYATNGTGNIVAWNQAAERLLGYEGRRVLGKRCYEVLRGLDVFGNRFCDKNCALVNMARRHEAVHHFNLNLRKAKAEIVQGDVSVIVVPAQARSGFTIIHTLKPLEPEREAEEFPHPTSHTRKPSYRNRGQMSRSVRKPRPN